MICSKTFCVFLLGCFVITLHYCKVGQSEHPLKRFLTPLLHCLIHTGRASHCGIFSWKRQQWNESWVNTGQQGDEHLHQMLDTRGTERSVHQCLVKTAQHKGTGPCCPCLTGLVVVSLQTHRSRVGTELSRDHICQGFSAGLFCFQSAVVVFTCLQTNWAKRPLVSDQHRQSIQEWKHPKCKLSYFSVYKQKSKEAFHTGVTYIILENTTSAWIRS